MLESLDTLIAFVLIMLVVSLLITIAVQVVAAALNLRGLNLLNGMSTTFTLIAPDAAQNTTELARCILKGRLVSDSFLPDWPIIRWWRHTTAMRPDEIFDAIHRIAIGKKRPDDVSLRQSAQSLLVALGVDKQTLENAANAITATQKEAKDLADDADKAIQLLTDEKVRTQVQAALESARAKLATYEAQTAAAAEKTVEAVAGSIDAAYQKFQYWTDICQERVQQWFAMHTRIITVAFAFVFAYWLQLDSVEVFKLVSSNRAVRDKIVAQAAGVTAQADKAFGDSKTVLQEAFDAWPDKTDPTVQTAVASIKVEPNDTREKLTDRIKTALASVQNSEAHLKSFNETVDETATDILKEKAGDYNTVKADFENTGFDLFPKSNKGRWGNGASWSGTQGHRWGILFSAGLLSLGAPFWYNALKNLMSLRSTVAQNISKEKQQEKKQPDEAKSLKPPPTVMPPN